MQPILLLVACLLAPVYGQRDMYTVKNYPDPVDNYEACGRPGPSFICDPSEFLTPNAASAIDDLVKGIYNETTVPCYSSGPQATRRKGYLVMLAIMPKMERYFTVGVKKYNMRTRYREAQHFSYYLGQENRWGKHSSNCNEMVIILYSVEDNVLYTSTQSIARRKLKDSHIQDVVMSALTRHYPFNTSNRRAVALNYIVRQYGESLREDLPTA